MTSLKLNTVMTAVLALTSLTSQTSFAAEAEEQLTKVDETNQGEVIVTTRKREENLMDVPISLTIFTTEDIQDAGITSIADIANLTPGFNVAALFGGGANTPVIRGLSTTIGETNVGFFIDGVYQSSRSIMESLLGNNIERIEVAKGPQSALYGRNTFGGAINIVTKRPSNIGEGEIKAGIGDFNSQDFRFTYSGPIGDMNYRVWANRTSRDGYYNNDLTGSDLDDRETTTFGLQLVGGSEDFNYTVTFNNEDTRDGGNALKQIENNSVFASFRGVFPPDFQLFTGEVPSIIDGFAVSPGHDDRDNVSSSLKFGWSLDGMTFTAITGYNDNEGDNFQDDDFDPREIHSATTLTDLTEFSQEIRLQSDDSKDNQWSVGLYYYDLDFETDLTAGYLGFLAPIFGSTLTVTNESTESIALFGSYDWQVNDNINLTLSGRYSQEKKAADATNTNLVNGDIGLFNDSDTFKEFTPRVDLEYHLDEGGLIYGSVARAVKSGGFNVVTVSGAILDDERTYDVESSINYEVGYKQSYMDHRVNLTTALFYIDWKDQIVRALGATNAILNVNAGESSSKGFELELNARPADNFTIQTGLAYTDASYDEYTFGALTSFGVDPVLDGTRLQYVSDWQANVSFQYRGGQVFNDFNWFARSDTSYQTDQSITQNAFTKIPDISLTNLRVGIENNDWRIYLWANNIFDDDGSLSGVLVPSPAAQADAFVFGLRPGFPVFQSVIDSPNPRTYGITAYYNF